MQTLKNDVEQNLLTANVIHYELLVDKSSLHRSDIISFLERKYRVAVLRSPVRLKIIEGP